MFAHEGNLIHFSIRRVQMNNIKKKLIHYKCVVVLLVILATGLVYYSNFKIDNQDLESFDTFKGQVDTDKVKEESTEVEEKKKNIYVYICGCVLEPGVKECTDGIRLYELIDLAGGETADADLQQLNLANILKDGEKIYVPSINEIVTEVSFDVDTQSEVVNINKATSSQLMTLPGIGQSRADDIIEYRTKNGDFSNKEDIMNVNGIKEALYSEIMDKICV